MSSVSKTMMSDPSQQLSSRSRAPLVQANMKVRQSPTLEQVTDRSVQELRAPFTSRPSESQRFYFPSESPIQRFRGDVIGRGVGGVSAGQGIPRLPKQVQPFDPSLSSEVISSLNHAELAAIGAMPSPARGGTMGGGEEPRRGYSASGAAGREMISSFNPAELAAIGATPSPARGDTMGGDEEPRRGYSASGVASREMISSFNPVELTEGGPSRASSLSGGVDVSDEVSVSLSGTLPSTSSAQDSRRSSVKVDPSRRDFIATSGGGEVGVGLVYRKSTIVL